MGSSSRSGSGPSSVGLSLRSLERGVDGDAHGARPQRQLLNGARADTTGRHVDDAGKAHLVIGVLQQTQVGEEVLDLPPLVEAHPADELVGGCRSAGTPPPKRAIARSPDR